MSFLEKSYIAELITKIRIDFITKNGIPTISLWPNNADFCLVMSHYVDEPYGNYTFRYYLDEFAWKLGSNYSSISLFKTTVKLFGSTFNFLRDDKNFGFDFWYHLENKIGGNSAFYVSVINPYRDYSHRLDVPYNFDDYRIKKKLNELIESGWEIGLHASMNACESADRFLSEKYSLESILDGYKVRGVRHHYWRMGDDINKTHSFHMASGFEYDSSLGLNDDIGFRSGTIWPFQIKDYTTKNHSQFFEITSRNLIC